MTERDTRTEREPGAEAEPSVPLSGNGAAAGGPAGDGAGPDEYEGLPERRATPLPVAIAKLVLAIVAALVVVSIAILAFGADPFSVASTIVDTSFGNAFGLGQVITIGGILTLTGLAAALPFRAGFWNVGGEGQLFAGAIGATLVALSIGSSLGSVVGVIAVLLAAVIAGLIWGGIAGALKAAFNINEVIVSLMLVFIAFAASDYVIRAGWPQGIAAQTEPYPDNVLLPTIWDAGAVTIGPVIAIIVALGLWFMIKYMPLGFEIRAVGLNPKTARLNGISGGRIALVTFLIGGAAGGLAGGIAVLGLGALISNFSPQYGFVGIAVALLARLNPGWVIPAAFLFSVLTVGSNGLFVADGLDPAVGDLLVATFILALLVFGLIRLPTQKAGL